MTADVKAKLTLSSRRLSVINQEIDTEKKVEDVNIGTKCLVLKEDTAENSPDITSKSNEEPGKLSNESGAVTLVNKVRGKLTPSPSQGGREEKQLEDCRERIHPGKRRFQERCMEADFPI